MNGGILAYLDGNHGAGVSVRLRPKQIAIKRLIYLELESIKTMMKLKAKFEKSPLQGSEYSRPLLVALSESQESVDKHSWKQEKIPIFT